MSTPVPDWFWTFFMIVIIVLAGVGFQLHRIEKKLESIWRYFKESD